MCECKLVLQIVKFPAREIETYIGRYYAYKGLDEVREQETDRVLFIYLYYTERGIDAVRSNYSPLPLLDSPGSWRSANTHSLHCLTRIIPGGRYNPGQ